MNERPVDGGFNGSRQYMLGNALMAPSAVKNYTQMMEAFIFTLDHEYQNVWPDYYEKLEAWVEANDAKLEETKRDV